MKPFLPLFGLGIALAACQPAPKATKAEAPATAQPAAPQATMEAPAGDYTLDPLHSTLVFRLSHIGFSRYVGQFQNFEAALHLDPKAPETSTISVKIDPASLAVPHPPEGFLDDLRGANWLDAKQFPAITFKSTKVDVTGERTARVTGDLTLRGVTKPVVLEATLNGGYAGHPMDPHARVGLSATGRFKRSDFGMTYGIPDPGTTMGVGDEVEVLIEAEFTGPPLAKPAG